MDPITVGSGGLAGAIAVAAIEALRFYRAKANGGTTKERLVRLETKVDLILESMELRQRGK